MTILAAQHVRERAVNERMIEPFCLVSNLQRQRQFSEMTFGPNQGLEGVVKHIERELGEIRSKPSDLEEWIDVIILAFDGAWRFTGATPKEIVAALVAKQDKNESRKWPDWRSIDPNKPIEHDRSFDK